MSKKKFLPNVIPAIASAVAAMANRNKKKKNRSKSAKSAQNPAPNITYITAPVAKSNTFSKREPRLVASGKRLVVSHSEIMFSLTGSTSGAFYTLSMNPGNGDMFPWLSGIAQHYTYYRFIKLRFRYIPAVATSTAGTVAMAVDYDANSTPIDNPAIMATLASYQESPTWNGFLMEADPRYMHLNQPFKLVSGPGKIVETTSSTDFDVGNFSVYVVNQPSAVNCGRLFVEYICELEAACQPAGGLSDNLNGQINDGTTGLSLVAPFGSAGGLTKTGPLNINYSVAGVNEFVVPDSSGYLRLSFYVVGTGLTGVTWTDLGGAGYSRVTITNLETVVNSAGTAMIVNTRVASSNFDRPIGIYPVVAGTTVTGCRFYYAVLESQDFN